MRIFLAGSTGVIGRQLLPQLIEGGHHVIGLVRSSDQKRQAVEAIGADTVVADALDRASLIGAIEEAAPDAIVHMLTSIPPDLNPRRLAKDFALTNRLRTEGTRNLIDAAQRTGVKRVVAQGLAYAYDPGRPSLASESDPLWRQPPRQFAPVLEALRYLERFTLEAGGLVLRLGHLYGPGSIYAPGGSFIRQVRAGKVPIVGKGDSTFSFIHAEDVAAAVVASLETNVVGILNIVDDTPTTIAEWLPDLAEMLNAPQPKHVAPALARLATGTWGLAFMTGLRGADNTLARRSLAWAPRYPTWREGFQAELAGAAVA